jgi:hypothetical protein
MAMSLELVCAIKNTLTPRHDHYFVAKATSSPMMSIGLRVAPVLDSRLASSTSCTTRVSVMRTANLLGSASVSPSGGRRCWLKPSRTAAALKAVS